MLLRVVLRCFVFVVSLLLGASGGSASLWQKVKSGSGPLDGFLNYEMATELLGSLVQENPNLLRQERIGETYEKRPMTAYVLASDDVKYSRPQFYVSSLTHAREPASLSAVLYFIGQTLDLYKKGDPQTVYLMENREIWVVPLVNPDGYVEVGKHKSKRDRTQRKNMRPTCDRNKKNNGVDLNGNFGHHFSLNEFGPCEEPYSGTGAFSEPETQAIKKVIEEHDFKAAMNFHTFGGMLLYPFHFATSDEQAKLPAADEAIYQEIVEWGQWRRFGPVYPNLGYNANGEAEDWMYAKHNIIAMAPEIGPESGHFWPAPALIPGINEKNFKRIQHVAGKSGFQLYISLSQDASKHELKIGNRGLSISQELMFAVQISHIDGNGKPDVKFPGLKTATSDFAGDAYRASAPLMPLRRRDFGTLGFNSADKALSVRVCIFELEKDAQRRPTAPCQCVGPTTAAKGEDTTVTFVGSTDSLCEVATKLADSRSTTPAVSLTTKAPPDAPDESGGAFTAVAVIAVLCSMCVSCYLCLRCYRKRKGGEAHHRFDEEAGTIGRTARPLD